MKLMLQVVIQQDGEPPRVTEIACLERDTLTPETLGLSLREAKTVLAQVQETLATEQVAAVVADQQICSHCGATQRRKGQHQIVVRSLARNVARGAVDAARRSTADQRNALAKRD